MAKSLLVLLFFIVSPPLLAQDSTTSLSGLSSSKIKLSSALKNKKFEDDEKLTEPKLRAEAGSLSQYSFKSKIIYRGPTLGDWSAPDQPNPDGSPGNYAQALKGTITGRYRLSSDQALSAGGGLVINHPFHGMDRTDFRDPFFNYDLASRIDELQMRSSPGLTIVTTPDLQAVGQYFDFTFDQSLYYELGSSRFGLGSDNNFTWFYYNRPYKNGSKKKGGDGLAPQYSISMNPQLKYAFSDRLTVYGGPTFSVYNPRQLTNHYSLWNSSALFRLGLSYSPDRNKYFAVYFDTYPTMMTSNSTTLNAQTIFSVF